MSVSRIGVRMVLAGTTALGLLTVLASVSAQAAQGQTGFDISYPQCSGSSLGSAPSLNGTFDILGVNDGIVYSAYPWWYPTGQSSLTKAQADCTATDILGSGGHIHYTQYSNNGFDGDYDCG